MSGNSAGLSGGDRAGAGANVGAGAAGRFASYARRGVVDATAGTEVILVLGVETRDQVDKLASKAEAAGGSPVGTPRDDGYRYQRGFTDLDGQHWEALCLIDPAS